MLALAMRSAASSRPGTPTSSATSSAKKIARLMMLLRRVRDCVAITALLSSVLACRSKALPSDAAS